MKFKVIHPPQPQAKVIIELNATEAAHLSDDLQAIVDKPNSVPGIMWFSTLQKFQKELTEIAGQW